MEVLFIHHCDACLSVFCMPGGCVGCAELNVHCSDDHNCPQFDDMEVFCADVAKYLNEHVDNMVAIHCKAGKGRTGLMICVFMLYAGVWSSAYESLR